MEYSELGRYILALCESQNLSMRQASIKADLEPGTISKILQRDGRVVPKPETLGKIAAGLGGDFYHMMSLAGHLPPTDGVGELDAELHAKFKRLEELIRLAAERDPEEANRLMSMIITPVEIMLSLDKIKPRRQAVSSVEVATDETTIL